MIQRHFAGIEPGAGACEQAGGVAHGGVQAFGQGAGDFFLVGAGDGGGGWRQYRSPTGQEQG